MVIAIIVASICALTLLMAVFFSTTTPPRKICYRCALPAEGQFMSLDYCAICREVVMRMYPAVHFDPPFGFPGAPGHDPLGKDPYNSERKGKHDGKLKKKD